MCAKINEDNVTVSKNYWSISIFLQFLFEKDGSKSALRLQISLIEASAAVVKLAESGGESLHSRGAV